MTHHARAVTVVLTLALASRPAFAQTVANTASVAVIPAGSVAGALAPAPGSASPVGELRIGALAPMPNLALSPLLTRSAPSARPSAGPRAGALSKLRALAPRLNGEGVAAALGSLFAGDVARAVPAGAAAALPGDGASNSGKLSFEEFGRAGEQAFYEGKLGEGEHGAVIGGPGGPATGPRRVHPEGDLPNEGEMRRRMELPTLTNPQREEKGIELLQLAGAGREVVTLKAGEAPPFDKFNTIFRQDAGRGRNNLIVVKPGRRADKVIVVGAHHDKVSVGEGKIDNWGGATMMANLYQAMKDEDTEATYVFIMFAREEEGLIGSQAFVRSLKPEQKSRIRAMVNVDTIGVDGTYSWKNNSTRWLLDLIAKVAKATGLDLNESYLNGGDADSSTFKRFTPAMTIFGASQDVIFDIIHSENDNMKAFNLGHYVNTAKLTLALLRALDKEEPPRVSPSAGRGLASSKPFGTPAASLHPYQVEYQRLLRR